VPDETPSSPQPAALALVMSGGGARAAYQVGILRAIARRWPAFRPDIITGVSAGAINAITLAARRTSFAEAVGLLSRLWSNLHSDNVFRTDPSSLRQIGWRWVRRLGSGGTAGRGAEGMLDTDPLRQLISLVVGVDGDEAIEHNIFAGELDAFAISATNYGTGRSVTWVQGRNIRSWDVPEHQSIRTGIGVDHVMASAALPLIFPAVFVGGAWYGDGGIRQIAPLSPAVRLGAQRILAVNTRYPKTIEEAARPAVLDYPPPAQIVGVLMNAIFLDTMDQDTVTLRRISELVRRLPADERGDLAPVDLMVLRPSVDIGRLAAEYEVTLPGPFRFLMRGLGSLETESPDWLSMLLFEPAYLQRLIEIGEADAEAQINEIGAFLRLPV
jgi:NTE family protein